MKACWSCGTDPDPDDAYCSDCGVSLTGHWYHSWWGILILTLFVLGPISLFLVYRSPRMTGTTKAILSVMVIGISLYGMYEFYTAYRTTVEAYRQMQGTGMAF